jgi:acyl-CoA thioesterase YciA
MAHCHSDARYAGRYQSIRDIFGGWLLGQMDIAGGISAAVVSRGRTATVAVDAMTFRKPVFVGDVKCIYTDLIRIGKTSIRAYVEAWVIRRGASKRVLVTDVYLCCA